MIELLCIYYIVWYCLFVLSLVKLAEHDCTSVCNAHQWHRFVSDTSALQVEDVYEGVSCFQSISSARNELLKPQKFTSVATITGKFMADKINILSICLFCKIVLNYCLICNRKGICM